jgi:hypothetical protein
VPLQLAASEWCDYSRTEAVILAVKAILRAEGLMAAKRKSATKKKSTTKARKKVGKVMHEYKHGELKSGRGGKVKSRKQAIAIGLSEARKAGAKIPRKKKS